MPIFKLTPVPARLEDAAWASTAVRAPCWVNAADEAEARSMVSARYQDAAATVPGHPAQDNPWLDPNIVVAAADVSGEVEVPYGTVLGTGPHM